MGAAAGEPSDTRASTAGPPAPAHAVGAAAADASAASAADANVPDGDADAASGPAPARTAATDRASGESVPQTAARLQPEHLPVFVNRPNRFASLGLGAWAEALRDLAGGWEICWRLVRRDVSSRYRQSLLGFGWAVLTPLAMTVVFFALREASLITVDKTDVPHPLFLYVGLVPWQLFQAGLTRGTAALIASPELVNRVRFPREILVLAALGGALFDFAIGFVLMLALLPVFGVLPAWTIVLTPLVVAMIVLLSLALSLVLSVLNGALRDLGTVVPLVAMLWMLLTPVLYPASTESDLGLLINWLNPMAPLVTTFRDLAFEGTVTLWGPLACACGITLVALPLAWRFFHVLLPRIAETI